jgi:parvulin-like peptidyl-prolyl isomerase
MKRMLAVMAVFAIVVSACSGSSDVVASVNGEDVVRSQAEVLEPQTDDGTEVVDFTRYLSVVIQWEAISQAAAELGVEPTSAEIDQRLDELVAVQGPDATLEDYLTQVNASEEGIKEFAKQLVIQDAIQEQLLASAAPISEDTVNNEILNSPLDWTVVCASHILVESEEEATAVSARLVAGEEFAVVAQEVSLDPGSGANGGDLGCNSPSGYVEEFAVATMTAEIDVPTEAVQSEFGYHVILVSQREEATADVVREALTNDALNTAVDDWFVDVIAAAIVTVDDEIGVWVTEPTPQVVSVN